MCKEHAPLYCCCLMITPYNCMNQYLQNINGCSLIFSEKTLHQFFSCHVLFLAKKIVDWKIRRNTLNAYHHGYSVTGSLFGITKFEKNNLEKLFLVKGHLCVSKRGSRSTAKLQMEFLVKTMLPFLENYTLLRIPVPYF